MFARSDVHKSGMLALVFLLLCIGAACTGPKAAPPAATAPPETQGTPMSGERVVVVEQAPLRAAPSVDGQPLAMLTRGEDLTLVAASPDKAWYLVHTDVYTGTGWILAELVDLPTARAVARTAGVVIYAGPGVDYEPLAKVHTGWELDVVGQVNDCAWLDVVAPTGTFGWVSGRDVVLNVRCKSLPVESRIATRPVEVGVFVSPIATEPVEVGFFADSILVQTPVRSGPGTDYDLIGLADAGRSLQVTGQVNACEWLQVPMADGSSGWVYGHDATLSHYGVILTRPCEWIPAATAVAPPHPAGVLGAPSPVAPEDNATFHSPEIMLEWSPVKELLAEDEYYLVAIQFRRRGDMLTDYVATKESRWQIGNHGNVIYSSDDGRYEWSVQLVRMKEAAADGVSPVSVLSAPSASRKVAIYPFHPPPTPTPDCGGYPCGLREVPTPAQLLATAGWLGLGLLIGVTLVTGRPLSRKKRGSD
jgi:uncharacterized protein YraI